MSKSNVTQQHISTTKVIISYMFHLIAMACAQEVFLLINNYSSSHMTCSHSCTLPQLMNLIGSPWI